MVFDAAQARFIFLQISRFFFSVFQPSDNYTGNRASVMLDEMLNLKTTAMLSAKEIPQEFADPEESSVLIGSYGMSMDTHMDYLQLAHDHESRPYSLDEVEFLGKMIHDSSTEMVPRKRAMGILAHLGTTEAYRILEQYFAECPESMKAWAELALMECRMFLEGAFGKENVVYMGGGLGGDGSRMRHWILLLPTEGRSFAEKDRLLVNDEARFVAMRRECGLEKVELFFPGIAITALVPLRVAVGDFLEDVVAQSQILGCPISVSCYVTNSHIPNQSECLEIMDRLRNSEGEDQANR